MCSLAFSAHLCNAILGDKPIYCWSWPNCFSIVMLVHRNKSLTYCSSSGNKRKYWEVTHVFCKIHFHWFPSSYTDKILLLSWKQYSWTTHYIWGMWRDCPFCPPVVRGGFSGVESSVSDDTSSGGKTNQTDYCSDDTVERAGPGLMLFGVILCDLLGNYYCVWPRACLPVLRQSEVSGAVSPIVLSFSSGLTQPYDAQLPSTWADHTSNFDNPSVLISSIEQLPLKFEFHTIPLSLRRSLTFDNTSPRLSWETMD